MKKIKNILIFSVLIFFSACSEDFLDTIKIGEQTSATFYATDDELVKAANACYAPLWHYVYNWARTDLSSYPTDESIRRESNGLHEYTFTAVDLLFSRNYRYNYRGILIANNLIYNVDGIEKPLVKNKELQKRVVGEAKYMRAYYYFDLVKLYGDVPLVTKPLNADEINLARTSADLVYASIEQDLKDAIAVLPKKSEYAATDLGRATKGAALALLVKVCVAQASPGYQGQSFYDASKWAEAKTYAEQLFALTDYSLYTGTYSDIFRESTENGVESIFEVQFYNSPFDTDGAFKNNGNFTYFLNLPWFGAGDPYGEFQNTYDLYAAFETDDPRRDQSVITNLQWAKLWGSATPVQGDLTGLSDYKHYISKAGYLALGNTRDCPINERVIRLSDIYLLYAEACYHTSDEPNARLYVNKVRERARAGNSSVLPDVTATGTALLDAIYRERRVELCNEGHRWHDLVRTGLLEKEVKTDGYAIKANVVDNGNGTYTVTNAGDPIYKATSLTMPKHMFYPIPQTEIDYSHGTITQNPGY